MYYSNYVLLKLCIAQTMYCSNCVLLKLCIAQIMYYSVHIKHVLAVLLLDSRLNLDYCIQMLMKIFYRVDAMELNSKCHEHT